MNFFLGGITRRASVYLSSLILLGAPAPFHLPCLTETRLNWILKKKSLFSNMTLNVEGERQAVVYSLGLE